MFACKVRVEYEAKREWRPTPLDWLDNFAMRNFTNDAIFDDTLPVADGWLEIGARVPLDRLKAAMEDWFRRKGYIGKQAELRTGETVHFSLQERSSRRKCEPRLTSNRAA